MGWLKKKAPPPVTDHEGLKAIVGERRAEVIRLINIARAENHLPPLTSTPQLTHAANIRALELGQSFSHTRPDGRKFSTVFQEAGIVWTYETVGENIAMNYPTPEAVVDGWMHSKGHRENILRPAFVAVGIGCARDANVSDYWVQIFFGSTPH